MIRFADPQMLWLLLALPLFWWGARRLVLIPLFRRALIIATRTLLILLLVFALAKAEWRRESKDLSVFYLLDRSDSIPPELQKAQVDNLIALSKRSGKKDATGVIIFGDKPSIETAPTAPYEYPGRIESVVEGDRSDLSAAVRLALAAFPADNLRRVVLMTDGNENSGSVLEQARLAKNSGVPIDVIPLQYSSRNDVQIQKLVVPERTTKDAPFDLKVHLTAERETEGLLRLFRSGELIAEEKVTVRPGKNAPLVMTQRLEEGGFHEFTATIEAAGDARPQNNKAAAFTYLKAEPKVLLIDGSDDFARSSQFLISALRTESIQVVAGPPAALPINLEELQKYETLILSNVSASMMSGAQMQMIERAVHDLGLGLVMIGGENGFGAGGFNDTPIEKALPVSMDIKQKKVLPNGALVVVLHTCEIPSGNAWAKEVSIASLNVLSAQDYFGIAFLGSTASATWQDMWLWDPAIQMVGDKKGMRQAIKGVQPLDMMSFDPTLNMAAKELAKTKAQTKHIVIISDGDPAPPSQATVNAIRNQGITVSTIAIAPHDGTTVTTLEQIAFWGAGNFYYPKTSNELPRIFTKEATVVRKSLIREETFNPVAGSFSEMLTGFSSLPSLDGYVVTSQKDLAAVPLLTEWEDPLLAHWRYGLGKTVAFTSDARDKWSSDWVQWGNFAKFWAQVVRWSLRETNNADYDVNTEIEGGTGRVTVDAVDNDGNFINFLKFGGTAIGPDFESMPLSVQQVAPGRYEATFPAGKVGTYMISLQNEQEEGEVEFLTSGVSLAYSPEYETSRSADEFMRRVADNSGGQFVADATTYNPYLRNLAPVQRPQPIWPWLLLCGIVLVPVDVFLRRVYLDRHEFVSWIREKVLGLMPQRSAQGDKDRLEGLKAAKGRATAEREEQRKEAETRTAFRERLAQREGEQPKGQGSVFDQAGSSQGAIRPGKQTITPENEGAPQKPGAAGLGSLMEAKKRAQQRNKKQD